MVLREEQVFRGSPWLPNRTRSHTWLQRQINSRSAAALLYLGAERDQRLLRVCCTRGPGLSQKPNSLEAVEEVPLHGLVLLDAEGPVLADSGGAVTGQHCHAGDRVGEVVNDTRDVCLYLKPRGLACARRYSVSAREEPESWSMYHSWSKEGTEEGVGTNLESPLSLG